MTTMEEWLEAYADALDRPVPDDDAVEEILDLAATAAHSSERKAAPVTCWLAAAAGLTPGRAGDLAEQVAGSLEEPS